VATWPCQVSKKDAVVELTRPVAGVLLTLMSNLSQTFRAADMLVQPTADSEPSLSQYVAVLDERRHTAAVPPPTTKSSTPCGASRSAYSASFQVVLRGLLQHIISCSEFSAVKPHLHWNFLFESSFKSW